MNLGAQFAEKIKKQMIPMRKEGAKVIAEGIIEQMEENVDRGVGFDSGQYEREYAPRTIRDRKGKYQIEHADLQRSQKRVKTAFVSTDAVRSTISFARGGSMLFFHQWGMGNNPRRQLFPDVRGGGQNSKGNGKLSQPASMPQQIVKQAHKLGTKLMNRPV